MKVFVTGASGFIGSAVVTELIRAGHSVTGLARSAASAAAITAAGAQPWPGTLEDTESLQQAAAAADGVIHLAFIHDFTQYHKAGATDQAAIEAMGEALRGTGKPLVVTAGILGLPQQDGYTTESVRSAHALRPSEATALALAETGVQASVVRLSPSVHDKGDKGFVPFLIQQARQHGVSAYPGDGNNRWPAVHRLDAARLFRLALEKAAAGTCYHGVAEEGIPVREIAELIGRQLQLPVASLEGEAAARHFEWMTTFIGFNSPSTSLQTQEQLGWQPVHTGLLEDMALHYF